MVKRKFGILGRVVKPLHPRSKSGANVVDGGAAARDPRPVEGTLEGAPRNELALENTLVAAGANSGLRSDDANSTTKTHQLEEEDSHSLAERSLLEHVDEPTDAPLEEQSTGTEEAHVLGDAAQCKPQVSSLEVDKLSARVEGKRLVWRGRLYGGGNDLPLDGDWVRLNFRLYFRKQVIDANGGFVKVPVGNAQERPPPAVVGDLRGECGVPRGEALAELISSTAYPKVAYPQCEADHCAAYGLASAVHACGDPAAAAIIAAAAAPALASRDSFAFVRGVVQQQIRGWNPKPIHNHDPLATTLAEPVHLQLVGSDGAAAHAVATLGDLIFDSAEERALPLTRESLDRCVGKHLNGATFSKVARATRLEPGKRAKKRMRCG